MIPPRRCLLAAFLGLWMNAPAIGQELPTVLPPSSPVPAAPATQEPREPGRLGVDAGQVVNPPAVSLNQKIADTIAERLRQDSQLRHYSVEISYQDGVAELTGLVADQSQREETLRIVQGVPGVERVRDRLEIKGASSVRPAQADGPRPIPEPGPLPKPGGPFDISPPPEPTPIFQAQPPGGVPPAMQAPRMPPYAWPTYAPYNNYSRVAYPTLYPYQSWPFIGPYYPFPKIPPGWRSISLTWQDGYWWYGKNASSHDWWRIRYY